MFIPESRVGGKNKNAVFVFLVKLNKAQCSLIHKRLGDNWAKAKNPST